jgi:hypothetical protein
MPTAVGLIPRGVDESEKHPPARRRKRCNPLTFQRQNPTPRAFCYAVEALGVFPVKRP